MVTVRLFCCNLLGCWFVVTGGAGGRLGVCKERGGWEGEGERVRESRGVSEREVGGVRGRDGHREE